MASKLLGIRQDVLHMGVAMKYTTNDFRIDSEARTIECFKPTRFITLYRAMTKCWGAYAPFCVLPFPNEITSRFPVTTDTQVQVGTIKI